MDPKKLMESNREARKFIQGKALKRMTESLKECYGVDVADKATFNFDSPAFSWQGFRESAYKLASKLKEANAETVFGALLRAGINNIANTWYELVETNHEKVGATAVSNKRIELYAPLHRGAVPRRVEQGQSFPETRLAGLDIEIENEKFGAIVGFERELFDDDQTGQITQRARDIVSSLRTFSHQDPALRRPVDLHLAIDHALMLLGHEIKQGITVVRDYAELPFITANPGQLTQVFMNLVINAVQAMRGRPNQKITITTALRDHAVHVSVADTGPGIAPEHLPRLFEPFFTTKDVGEGTGLGLAIAYGIITDHRGRITAQNLPGSGAVFEITLPAEI